MKILVDCHCFDYPTPQGINTYLRGLYSSLIPIAKDIEFYLAANNIGNLKSIFGEHRNVVYVKIPHKGSAARLFMIFPSVIRKYSIDFAHFQYVAPFIKTCKTIITLHDILFLDFPEYFPLSYRISKGMMFKYSAKKADLLLTVSSYSQKQISKHYKIEEENIYVTHNAIIDRFSNISKENACTYVSQKFGIDRYILYVSRLEPRKDQFGLIKAFVESNVYKDGISLVIVGEESIPDKRIDCFLSTLDISISSKIYFLKGIKDKELALLYRGATVFVYPSKAEGFGIPPLEAAVAEIPTICNNITAMEDFDFFGQNLINTADISNLAQVIRHTINNPNEKHELYRIREEILKRYNWDSIAQGFYGILMQYNHNATTQQ